jgi:FMN phosphatase YigB (HAD superfamily)
MIKLICSDVNGVLEHVDHDYSKSGYYKTKNKDPEFSKIINNVFFEYKYLIKGWMKSEISSEEINKILSKKLNIEEEYLNKILTESIKEYEWNWDLINLYQVYRQKGIKVFITTDNMEIFSKIAVPHCNFNKYFDKIYNSADIKLLKEENNYQIFYNISKEYKLNTYEILIVDDSKKIIEETKKLGYKTYLYNMDTYKNFERWINDNLYAD